MSLRSNIIERLGNGKDLAGATAAPISIDDFDLNPDEQAHLHPRPSAVLVPLVDRPEGMSVLLTQRTDHLHAHAGQVSFPGGRVEPGDHDCIDTALRETEEEIGLDRQFIDVIGCLPDHIVITGFQVTPVIGLVRQGFTLQIDPTEVAGTFEAPLRHLLDPSTHAPRALRIGDEELVAYDLPWEGHNIWGATAGMLLTLKQMLED